MSEVSLVAQSGVCFVIQSVSRLSFLSVVGHLIRQKAVHKTTVKETKKKTKKKINN